MEPNGDVLFECNKKDFGEGNKKELDRSIMLLEKAVTSSSTPSSTTILPSVLSTKRSESQYIRRFVGHNIRSWWPCWCWSRPCSAQQGWVLCGAYCSNSEGGNGVIAMVDLLLKDLSGEMTEKQVFEMQAQEGYVRCDPGVHVRS